VKTLLVGLDAQIPPEAGDLGDAAGLPVLRESFLDEEPLLCRQRAPMQTAALP
jgi:hypothetical protein